MRQARMTRAEQSAMLGRLSHERFLGRVEDYLWIRGQQLTADLAAYRLGVSARTIVRIRAYLRRQI